MRKWSYRWRPLADRFWEKVDRNGPLLKGMTTQCWVWTGSVTDVGYGKIGDASKRTVGAHRVSWELHNGPVPEGKHVLHRCDNRKCIRPSHLFLGIAADNSEDMVTKGRGRGQPKGEAHAQAKLTEDDVRAIRTAEGSQREIAARFGVSQMTICRIRGRRLWPHVK